MSETSAPPAGWYYDPEESGLQRYWDGAAWTHQVPPIEAASDSPGEPDGHAEPKLPPARAIAGVVVASLLFCSVVTAGVLAVRDASSRAEVSGTVWEEEVAAAAERADSAARDDASALGSAILDYFLMNYGAPPEIWVEDGWYFVQSDDGYYDTADTTPRRIPVSPGVEFGGVTGGSPQQWCVWVTATDGAVKDFKSTTLDTAIEGTC